MRKSDFWSSERGLTVLLILLALLIWRGLMADFRLDDAFITYRYARNFMAGEGLVYNPGEFILSTTAPLYALLLGGLSLIRPDYHLLGGLVGALSIGLGGALIMGLLPRRMAFGLRAWAGVAYTLASPLWLSLGMETPLWIMLILAAIWAASRERWAWSGLLAGLSIPVRPDAALPGALLGLGIGLLCLTRVQTRSRPWAPLLRFGLAAALPSALFWGAIWIGYGSPLPATFSAKHAHDALGITGLGPGVDTWQGLRLMGESLLRQSGLYLLFGGLIVLGIRAGKSAPVGLIVAWGVLHLVAYAVLGIAPYRWYYAPVVPGLILLAALGADRLYGWLRNRPSLTAGRAALAGVILLTLAAQGASFARIQACFATGCGIDPLLPMVDWDAYEETGRWLAANTSPDATAGMVEIGQIGYFSERHVEDYLGLVDPSASEMLARGDRYSWFASYAPDTLVLHRPSDEPIAIYSFLLELDPWFQASYAPVHRVDDPRYAHGEVIIYQRTTLLREMRTTPADLDFGPLRLTGFATDAVDLAAGGAPVRVRLDWLIIGSPPARTHLSLTALDAGSTLNFDLDYASADWAGAFSTWATLVLDSTLPPGGYPVVLDMRSVDSEGAVIETLAEGQAIGWLDISYPHQPDLPEEAPTFSIAGNDPIQLANSAIAAEDGQLQVTLDWIAGADLMGDYTLFVHLRPLDDPRPAAQSDEKPQGGRYPTYLWQTGEAVPVALALDASPAPAGDYELVVGWYIAPDGPRLTLTDGGDALPLARIAIADDGTLTLE